MENSVYAAINILLVNLCSGKTIYKILIMKLSWILQSFSVGNNVKVLCFIVNFNVTDRSLSELIQHFR